MKLMIDIPDEFKNDFNKDRFADCFGRILADMSGHSVLCGNNEQETVEMLAAVFKDAKVLSEEKMQAVADKIPYINHFVKGELAVHIKNAEEYLGFITTLRKAGVEISNPADYLLNSGFYDPHYPFFYIHQGYQKNSKDMYMNACVDFKKLCKRTDTSISACIDYDEFIGGYEKGTKDNSPKPVSAKDFAKWIDTESGMTIIDSNDYGEYSPTQFSAEELLEMMIKTNQKQNDVDLEVSNDDLEQTLLDSIDFSDIYGVEQSIHGHNYRFIYTGTDLRGCINLPIIIKGHDFYEDIHFPFGGDNCSSTRVTTLESLDDVKDFLLAGYKTDYDDPQLIDIAEGVCTIDVSLSNPSITDKFVRLLHIPQNELTKDNALLAPAKQMIQELQDADTDYEIDFNNPFYGTSKDMRFSDLTALYEAYETYKDAMQDEPELD